MKKYIKLIDDIIVDILTDLKSLRYQLLLIAVGLNVWVIKQLPDVHYSVAITSLGLLTLAYSFWFASKHQENKNKAMNATDPEGD